MESRKMVADLLAQVQGEGTAEDTSLLALLQQLKPLMEESPIQAAEGSKKEEEEESHQRIVMEEQETTIEMPSHEQEEKEGKQQEQKTQDVPQDANNEPIVSLPLWKQKMQTTALLIISHDRSSYLDRCLAAVLKHHPGDSLVPIIVSEEGYHGPMASVVKKYQDAFKAQHPKVSFIHIHHEPTVTAENGYFKLADHYKWALSQVRPPPDFAL